MRPASPLVSVALPVHNGQPYLAAAVRSILDQSLDDLELVVAENASTDGTAEVLASFSDPRLAIVRSRELLPIADSHNLAAFESRGEFLAFMGADDVAHPERLARQVEALRADPSLGLVSSWVRVIDEHGVVRGALRFPTTDAELRRACFRYNPFLVPAATVRTSLFRELGGFDRRYAGAMDYDFTLRAMERARVANLPEELLDLRLHYSSESIRALRSTQLGAVRVRLAALRRGGYPLLAALWIFKPLLISALPLSLARALAHPYMLLLHGERALEKPRR